MQGCPPSCEAATLETKLRRRVGVAWLRSMETCEKLLLVCSSSLGNKWRNQHLTKTTSVTNLPRWHDEICITAATETSGFEVHRQQTTADSSPPTHRSRTFKRNKTLSGQIQLDLRCGISPPPISVATLKFCFPSAVCLPAGFHHAQCVTRPRCCGD